MKFRIYLKSFSKQDLLETSLTFKKILDNNKSITNSLITLPPRKRKFCLLSSPHKYKDSREQFEVCVYKAFFIIQSPSVHIIEELIKIKIKSNMDYKLSFF